MKVKQISLFLENKPGHLNKVCHQLADADINILTLSLADTQQFGILRLIVQDWEKAKEILEKGGAVVKVTDVIATEVVDEPGGLVEILDIIDTGDINIEYMYAFTFRKGKKAVMVFRFDDPDAAIELLQKEDINILGTVELMQYPE